jgi:hypothetical protein
VPRVIDGDNLLGTWPGRSRADADKRALVREVDQLTRREKRRIVVVFDGSPPRGVLRPRRSLLRARGGRPMR